MANIIYLKDENGKMTELRETPYNSEDVFQKLLEDYPTLLAGQGTDEDECKWVLLSREMEVPDHEGGSGRWFLDHLFVDRNATPILVEVKRSTDTRIRREVVGQMLDYAANATLYWNVEDIRMKFETNGGDLANDFRFSTEEVDRFWNEFTNKLKLAQIKLLFVADEIPNTLLRIIEFLNNQMTNTEVLGIEVKQYLEDGERQILVPKVLGQTAQANIVKKTEKGEWDYDSFLNDVERVGGVRSRKIAERMLNDYQNLGCRLWYGKGVKHASVVFCFDFMKNGKKFSHQFFSVYPWTKGVHLELDFQYFKAPFDKLEERMKIKSKLEDVLGITIHKDKLNGRPTYPLNILEDDIKYNKLYDVVKWMLSEVKRANE